MWLARDMDDTEGIEIEEVIEEVEKTTKPEVVLPTAHIQPPPTWVQTHAQYTYWLCMRAMSKDVLVLPPLRKPIHKKNYVLTEYEAKTKFPLSDGPIARLCSTSVCVQCWRRLLADEFNDLTGVCVYCKNNSK